MQSKTSRRKQDILNKLATLNERLYRAMLLKEQFLAVYKTRDQKKARTNLKEWIIAALRNHTFFSIGDLNRAIREKLKDFNTRPLQKLKVSRRHLFETIDKPAMKPLPERRYGYADWEKPKANIDYHVEVDHHYYSVPYQLSGQVVDARITATMVGLLFKRKTGGLPSEELSGRQAYDMPRAHAGIP